MSLDRAQRITADESDHLLHMFVERLHDHAVFLLDPTGKIISWNIGAQRIKGYAADEIVGRHFSCFYSSEDIAAGKPESALEIAARAGRFEEVGTRVRKDGSRFLANVVISAIRDENGVLRGFGKLTHDITELSATQELIKSSGTRLRSLVDTVLDTIVDGVITIDQRGNIQSFNKASVRVFGYAPEEVIGHNVRILMPTPYSEEHDTYLDSYRASRIFKIIGIGREVIGQRKDGSTFPMELAVGATSHGGDHAFVGIVRDITERREAEAAREQLRQAQKMEAIGQLTGGIAHDFNNILGVIVGNLDMLVDQIRTKDDGDPMELLTPTIDAAIRGSELTKQLLAYGRKQSLQPKTVSINELVANFAKMAHRVIGERIEIVVLPAPDLWNVFADPRQIEDALLNLSVNARDAMPTRGKLIFETQNVTVDEAYGALNPDLSPGDYAMLAVSDTGTGMTREVAAQAFDPFFTTKEMGKGSGLGLSMVYGFVKQSAGHIKIYSEVGVGTSIKIYLPRAGGPLSVAASEASVEFSAPAPTKRLVLVVEDNPNVLKMTTTMVESLGFAVLAAADGDVAERILAERSDIDLLFTDVMLSGKTNGPALAQLAAAMRPGIKILFTSGYAEQSIFEHGLLGEGAHLLGKPFRKQQLAVKIEEVLRE
jgi:PAS domain S-box-containing protein